MEQYSGRNNIRIVGLTGDVTRQASERTTEEVVAVLSKIFSLNLKETDIDIAHKLRSFYPEKNNKNKPL